jgi:predicted GNAT family N-acyltransferase
MEVKIASTEQELKDAFSVRREVFINEQGVSEEEEIDQFEDEATHIILYDGEKPVGAGRFRLVDGYGKVERICVLPSHRNKGAGKLIMEAIEQIARERSIDKLKLHAQTNAEPFYKKLGYATVSDIFMEAGIPHVTMIKYVMISKS